MSSLKLTQPLASSCALGARSDTPGPEDGLLSMVLGLLGGASLGRAFQKWAACTWCQRGGAWGTEWGVTSAITVPPPSSWEIANPSPGCWSKSPCTSGEIQPFVKPKLFLETIGLWKDLKLCSEVDLSLDPGCYKLGDLMQINYFLWVLGLYL